MSRRLPEFVDRERLEQVVSPKVRQAARRVYKQVALFVVAKLPTGARDDRPFKERLKVLRVVLVEEIVIQWERLRGLRGNLGPAWRNIMREVQGRLRGRGGL